MNLSPAALATLRARVNASKTASTPATPRLTTPDPELPTNNPGTDTMLFASTTNGIACAGTIVPPTPVDRIDLELDPTLATYLMSLAYAPGIHNIRLIGPSGCGKTSIGQWMAQETNRPLLIMDCAVVREPRDWFGFRTISNNSVIWQDTEFVRTVEAGNAVIVLDELNRAPSSVLNGIFSLTDHRRRAWIEERQRAVVVGPNTIFVATTNIGSRFVGASPIDEALQNRFQRIIEVDYLNATQESALLKRRIPDLTTHQADGLAEIGAATRNRTSKLEPFSTREMLAVAQDLATFGEHSLRYTMLSKIADQSKRAALATMLAGKFPGIIGSATPETTNTRPF